MNLPTPKDIQSLAVACRKAGIKHFRCGDIEFTLTDDAPIKRTRKVKGASATSKYPEASTSEEIPDDGLTPEQLLNWSVQDVPGASEGES